MRKPPPRKKKNLLERGLDYMLDYDPRRKPPPRIYKGPYLTEEEKEKKRRAMGALASKAKPRRG